MDILDCIHWTSIDFIGIFSLSHVLQSYLVVSFSIFQNLAWSVHVQFKVRGKSVQFVTWHLYCTVFLWELFIHALKTLWKLLTEKSRDSAVALIVQYKMKSHSFPSGYRYIGSPHYLINSRAHSEVNIVSVIAILTLNTDCTSNYFYNELNKNSIRTPFKKRTHYFSNF